ncbi:hypothetical protein TrLO_g2220 [Triparma laevis f. longispina]|uniref:RING-type domain-containing protein n=1 Tax=Triparma laevis f. longispina TaxID=1714387 RepID=A0A9W6ZZB4_9STRA|nr:hypothetical protein TrLO_g2220 [Triparma laevis f. longispina]
MRPCGHSAVCRECTRELMTRSQPCPICRKPISSFELARNDGFNEYFQKQFNGNEATYLRWKEIFDVLELDGGKGIYYSVRESNEQQVLNITRSEDLVKLRASAKLCSLDFFNNPSLSVVARRMILEVLELAMPEKKKVRGKKKQQRKKNDPRKLDILDACFALGEACNLVRDYNDSMRCFKRAKDGYEEQLGRESEKALLATLHLIRVTGVSGGEKFEEFRDMVKRMERVLGLENVVTLTALNALGSDLVHNNGGDPEYEEAIKVQERCLAGRTKVLGEDHKETLGTFNNLGESYYGINNYEKALEYFERALRGKEQTLGTTHPDTLGIVDNVTIIYLRM